MRTKTILTVAFTALIISLLIGLKKCGGQAGKDEAKTEKSKLVATILPVKFIVENITGDDFDLEVLVPRGASPESYEPAPRQIAGLADAELIFSVGLIDFERQLTGRLADQTDASKIVNLCGGIELIEGECSHEGHTHGAHNHGTDPHIWSSPKALKKMAENAYNAIALLYPDSARYERNYEKFLLSLDSLDSEVGDIIKEANVKYFIIYHPAFTYYARDYGLQQIAIEDDGKEPSAAHIKRIIDMARRDGTNKIFYQKEFSRSTVETVAGDIGAEIVEIDPLAENVSDNILKITKLIAE